MVFFKYEEEHFTHVSTVLTRLRTNSLFDKASKCLFHITSVDYLGYVVSSEGLKMDQAKVHKILNWPPPRNLKALQSFFTTVSSRITQRKLVHSPVSSRKIPVSPSMKNLLVSDSGKHPIAFDSRKRIPEELNYEISDKELLGIVWALKCWRAFLLFLSSSFEVITNHSSLQYFMSSKVLTHCQARWAEFHFSITYHPSRLATLLNALSHWDNIYLERGEDFISKNPRNFQQLIKQDEKALWQDSQYRIILQELGKGKSVQDYSPDSSSQLLLFKDWVVVPNDPTIQLRILQKRHDPPLAGHPGQEKALKLIKQDFHWSGMTQFIKNYVSSCQQFSRNKKFGLLKPLPIPNVKKSTIPNWHHEPPPPIIIEEEEEWEVFQILDQKFKRRKVWYLVEWKGFNQHPERSTWEPAKIIKNCPELVKDLHSLYPDQPGPNSSRA
ncbi:hypothetical protein O181_094158 [Austropuccinia psidii MF-1]|uniref:Chromo domain-containing protein n=1 Tax=Austropuccinia psidii MF-1 TaxID=1389203 RepID=A0A9Q3J2L9_9BASI|nr:hypothetical protein [Austropuccinia psidii MF-1]